MSYKGKLAEIAIFPALPNGVIGFFSSTWRIFYNPSKSLIPVLQLCLLINDGNVFHFTTSTRCFNELCRGVHTSFNRSWKHNHCSRQRTAAYRWFVVKNHSQNLRRLHVQGKVIPGRTLSLFFHVSLKTPFLSACLLSKDGKGGIDTSSAVGGLRCLNM